jgi:hypothetical protein
MLCTLALLTGCSDDDDDPLRAVDVINNVSGGTWQVTQYLDNGVDETTDYNGYTFTFETSNVLKALKDGVTTNGTWSAGVDDGVVELVLNFSSPAALIEISDDWDVLENSTNKIRLEDDSDSGTGTDILVFERL